MLSERAAAFVGAAAASPQERRVHCPKPGKSTVSATADRVKQKAAETAN
jgi:hypothetical protein